MHSRKSLATCSPLKNVVTSSKVVLRKSLVLLFRYTAHAYLYLYRPLEATYTQAPQVT